MGDGSGADARGRGRLRHRAAPGLPRTGRHVPARGAGAMPLLTGGPLQVAAVGARNLHLLATREGLGPLRGQEVAVEGSLPGLDWTLRFYDPVVAPALGLISEDDGPAYAEVRGGAGRHDRRLPRRRAAGVGADAAPRGPRRRGPRGGAHGGGARLRDDPHAGPGPGGAGRRVGRGRARGTPPRAGAAGAGDRPARRGGGGAGRRRGASPDPDEVRKALLASVGGRSGWTPPPP